MSGFCFCGIRGFCVLSLDLAGQARLGSAGLPAVSRSRAPREALTRSARLAALETKAGVKVQGFWTVLARQEPSELGRSRSKGLAPGSRLKAFGGVYL